MTKKTSEIPKPQSLMGLKVIPFADYDQACTCIGQLIAEKKQAVSVAINPEKIYKSHQEPALQQLLNQAEVAICDGIGAALAYRVLYGQPITRITGVSLFFALIKAAADKGWRIYLLGASSESNKTTGRKLRQQNPHLQIVGQCDGYFTDTQDVITDINNCQTDILMVAMGSPKQEMWMAENRAKINASFCMGVGGTFDVVSGKAKWAPAFFRKTGTEWLYRLLSEPKRWRRQLALPKFLLLLLRYKLSGQK